MNNKLRVSYPWTTNWGFHIYEQLIEDFNFMNNKLRISFLSAAGLHVYEKQNENFTSMKNKLRILKTGEKHIL